MTTLSRTIRGAGIGTLALLAAAAFTSMPAAAKGCIKGAIVGGIAGHAVHHGFMGAVAGCAIGHHEANKHAHPTSDTGPAAAPPTPDAGSAPAVK